MRCMFLEEEEAVQESKTCGFTNRPRTGGFGCLMVFFLSFLCLLTLNSSKKRSSGGKWHELLG